MGTVTWSEESPWHRSLCTNSLKLETTTENVEVDSECPVICVTPGLDQIDEVFDCGKCPQGTVFPRAWRVMTPFEEGSEIFPYQETNSFFDPQDGNTYVSEYRLLSANYSDIKPTMLIKTDVVNEQPARCYWHQAKGWLREWEEKNAGQPDFGPPFATVLERVSALDSPVFQYNEFYDDTSEIFARKIQSPARWIVNDTDLGTDFGWRPEVIVDPYPFLSHWEDWLMHLNFQTIGGIPKIRVYLKPKGWKRIQTNYTILPGGNILFNTFEHPENRLKLTRQDTGVPFNVTWEAEYECNSLDRIILNQVTTFTSRRKDPLLPDPLVLDAVY